MNIDVIEESKADLIVLAGCLMYIPPKLIEKYHNRIINIHPSLIPSFCGKGYYGLTVHEKALKRGVKVTGATVHFVDEVLDNGPIILQKAVMIEEGDTPEVLAEYTSDSLQVRSNLLCFLQSHQSLHR